MQVKPFQHFSEGMNRMSLLCFWAFHTMELTFQGLLELLEEGSQEGHEWVKQGPGEGWAERWAVAVRKERGVGAYLDKQQSCCRVSAHAVAHYTGCCRKMTHRNECDSASPPHMWQNRHSTLTTPHLKLSLLGKEVR